MNPSKDYPAMFLTLLLGFSVPLCATAEQYVSQDAKAVTDSTSGRSYEERLRHVELFNGVIPDGDMETYLAFLSRHPEDDSVNEERLGTIKNDIADKLIKAKRAPEELGRILLANIDDEKQGLTWRNYALQKLGAIYEIVDDKELKAALVEKLKEKALDPENYNSSTALLGLYWLSQNYDCFKAETDKLATQILEDDKFTAPDKGTALEIAARLGDAHAAIRARQFLASRDTLVCLKVASIASLGIVGDASDLPTLEHYAKSGEIRFRYAARQAIDTLETRRNVSK